MKVVFEDTTRFLITSLVHLSLAHVFQSLRFISRNVGDEGIFRTVVITGIGKESTIFFKNYLRSANTSLETRFYRAFHAFGQSKLGYGGLILGLSKFSLLPSCLKK